MDLSINIFNDISTILKNNFINMLKDTESKRDKKNIMNNFVNILKDK